MSIWWNGGNQLISSLAVMKCVVQAAAPSQCRQCPGVLYLFPVHARSVRPSPLTPPSPGPSAHKRTARPCPDSVSPHQWPWHKAQTFNKIKSTLKSVSVTFLISCNKINCIWIFILISFLSVTQSGLWLLMMLIDWDSSKCQGRKLQPCDEQKPCGNGDVMLLSSR